MTPPPLPIFFDTYADRFGTWLRGSVKVEDGTEYGSTQWVGEGDIGYVAADTASEIIRERIERMIAARHSNRKE